MRKAVQPWPGFATSRRALLRGAASALACTGLGAWHGLAGAAPLLNSDRVLVFPTVAHGLPDGRIGVRIEAWVAQRESKTLQTRLLAKALGLDFDELPPAERERFVARTALFGADAKAGRVLALRWAGAAAQPLPPSDAEGRIQAVAERADDGAAGRWIDWALEAGPRRFESRALWPGDEGLSIVSDIDDTIKHTQMMQTREMLLNTFAREFTAVPGMAAWYQRIAQTSPAAFHYLSGGPMQLQPAMSPFLRDQLFPDGSLHLRAFSLRPDALLDKQATARHKHAVLTQLLADHPRRRFVLIGDSGEQDPETYGAITRLHPGRVAAILIRDVTHRSEDPARFALAFDGVPPASWQVFDTPEALPSHWA